MSLNLQGRTVVLLKYIRTLENDTRGQYVRVPTDQHATFVCFSTSHEEYENGPGPYPVAIVIRDTGYVDVIDADLIQFEAFNLYRDN